ncbi:hypothetical protein GCM10027075_55520 [Streptomyces heilongjiangensis]
MLRHEFQPGKLVGGLFVTAAGVLYLGDAGGAWETPWFVALPLTFGGLCLAGAVAFMHHAIRGHRASGRTGEAGGGLAGAAGWTGPAQRAEWTERTGPEGTTGSAGSTGHIPGGGQ